MILQLNPPIPLQTPKGTGLAWLVLDYGAEHHLMWTVAINGTGEIWTFANTEVRAEKNVTMQAPRKNESFRQEKKEYPDWYIDYLRYARALGEMDD